MSEVSHNKAMSFLNELKRFAFSESSDFRSGLVAAVDTEKRFYLPTRRALGATGVKSKINQMVSVGFSASSKTNKSKKYPTYLFEAYATSEKSLLHVPAHIWEQMSLPDADDDEPEIYAESQLPIVDLSDYDFTESNTTTFSVASNAPDEIEVLYHYNISANGESVFDIDSNDVLSYDSDGTFVAIPKIESEDNANTQFIAEPITHEMLADADRALADIAFQQIIESNKDELSPFVDYGDAATRMRSILRILRNGANIRRIENL